MNARRPDPGSGVAAAPLWLRAVARLVPPPDRAEWLEEWLGELTILHRSGAPLRRRVGFALGTVPHAVSLRGVGWSTRGVGSDLRMGVRSLVRRPGFSAVAALTLALGIAANASLFNLVDGLLLQPPPGIHDPGSLVQLGRSYDDAPRWDNFSWPAIDHIRDADHLFDGVAAYTGRTLLVGDGPGSELVPGIYVSGEFFHVLGVVPGVGRLLDESDDRVGAPATAVLSHRLWVRRFGSDPAVVGSSVRVGGTPYEIVGVTPRGFDGIDKLAPPPDLYLATAAFPALGDASPRTEWGFSWLWTVARLRPGLDVAAARAGLDAVTLSLRTEGRQTDAIRVLLEPGVGLSPAERAESRRLALLMAAVAALVLVLTCANLAGLFLTRAVDRHSEFALRRTLGAGGGRIARQLLIESVVLAGLATLLAAPLVHLGAEHMGTLIPSAVSLDFTPDARVYTALFALGIAAGLVFGGAPAIVATRRAPGRGIGSSRTSTAGRTTNGLRHALVVAQVALSLGLLSGAGLLLRSVTAALSARPGIDPVGVLAASLNLRLTGRYDDPRATTAFLDRLTADLEADPRISKVALSSSAVFVGPMFRESQRPLGGGDDRGFEADMIQAEPEWFGLMDLAFVEGRPFAPEGEPEPSVVVDETLAALFWPNGSAVGQFLDTDPASRVVGVVEAARTRSLRRDPAPTVYAPLAAGSLRSVAVQVRLRPGVAPSEGSAALRSAVAALDPALPVAPVFELQERMADTLGETRNLGTIVAAVSGLALLLATLGLYASLAYTVAAGARDLAVRIAVGAHPRAVFGTVLRRGLVLVSFGVAAGLGVAWLLGRALARTLYTVGVFDPLTIATVVILQVVIALAATAIPARRATRLDPCVTLRGEA